MIDPFFAYFKDERHTLSKQLYGPPSARYKTYPRFQSVSLPPAVEIENRVVDLLKSRRSTREYNSQSISLQQLSTLLHWAAGEFQYENDEASKRPYPSGGAKYPIEIYPIVQRVGGMDRAVYHYNVREHSLEHVTPLRESLQHYFDYPFVNEAACIICFSFVKKRSIQKYGALAYKLALIEVGHIAQNMYLISQSIGLGCCALGGDGNDLGTTIGLDGLSEHMVSAVAIGSPR